MSPEADPLAVTRAASVVQGTVVGLLAGFKLNGWQIELPITSASAVRKAIAILSQAHGVQGAEPNRVLEAGGVVPNDPAFTQQWGLPRTRADVAWAVGRSSCLACHSTPISIGIIDTGVNYTAPDFAGTGKVILGSNLVQGATTSPMDDNGHGTQVAGIASANMNDATGVAGVAPNSHIRGGEGPRCQPERLHERCGGRRQGCRPALALRPHWRWGATRLPPTRRS
jgi:subtilisin family serine protease